MGSEANKKSEFQNERDYHIGVMAKREDGRGMKGINVPPNGTIWLDEEEQIATANAPRRPEDNPFNNGDLTLLTSQQSVANRRPIGDSVLPNPEDVTAAPAATEDGGDAAGNSGGEAEGAPAPAAEEPEADAEKTEATKEKAPEGRRDPTPAEEEESARNAAARATKAPTPEVQATKTPPTTKAAEGSRPATETVATPEAQDKS